jgi:diguanylate cyclase (GGDEF)-like protein
LLRPQRRPSRRSARVGALDFSLLALWWLFLYVSFVVCWQLFPNEDAYNRNFDVLAGAQNILLACVAASFWLTSSGRWRKFYALFCGAVVFNGIAFYALNRAIELNVYYTGSWYDIPYEVSFAAYSALAVVGRGLAPIGEPETDESYSPWSYASWMSSIAMAAVLSLPVIAAYTLFNSNLPHEAAHFRVLVSLATMFAMALLLFIRHNLLNRELRNTNVVLQEESLTDPLTGLRNRRYFSATIEADASQALRAHADGQDPRARDLVFYLVDADNFKEVNDRYGHDIGDKVLIEMAHRLSTSIRHSDVLVRWGGEEFLIVSRYTDRGEAGLLAQRVLSAVADTPFALGRAGESIYRTCSLGWAAFPWFLHDPRGIGYEEVLALADRGLREAKSSGKNCAVGMLPMTGAATSSGRGLQHLGLQVEVVPVSAPRSTR